MMVIWMCGVSLKDRKCSVDLYRLLRVQSVAEVVRPGRLRWFGHVERKGGNDWVSACRNVVVAGVRCAGRGRKTWRTECLSERIYSRVRVCEHYRHRGVRNQIQEAGCQWIELCGSVWTWYHQSVVESEMNDYEDQNEDETINASESSCRVKHCTLI